MVGMWSTYTQTDEGNDFPKWFHWHSETADIPVFQADNMLGIVMRCLSLGRLGHCQSDLGQVPYIYRYIVEKCRDSTVTFDVGLYWDLDTPCNMLSIQGCCTAAWHCAQLNCLCNVCCLGVVENGADTFPLFAVTYSMNNNVLLYCIVRSVQLQYIQMVPTLHSPYNAGHYNWLTAGTLMEPYDRRHMRHSCHEQNVLYRKDVLCSYIVHVVKVLRASYQSGCGFKSMLLECRSNTAQSYSGEMVDMSNLYSTIFTFSIDHGSIIRLRDDETWGKVICFIDGFRWFVGECVVQYGHVSSVSANDAGGRGDLVDRAPCG